MAITKRPCANCPFRNDDKAVELADGRLEEIVTGLLTDDHSTFVCHKTLQTGRQTCAGALAVMSKLGRMPVIGRLGLVMGVIEASDVKASEAVVIDPASLKLSEDALSGRVRRRKRNAHQKGME